MCPPPLSAWNIPEPAARAQPASLRNLVLSMCFKFTVLSLSDTPACMQGQQRKSGQKLARRTDAARDMSRSHQTRELVEVSTEPITRADGATLVSEVAAFLLFARGLTPVPTAALMQWAAQEAAATSRGGGRGRLDSGRRRALRTAASFHQLRTELRDQIFEGAQPPAEVVILIGALQAPRELYRVALGDGVVDQREGDAERGGDDANSAVRGTAVRRSQQQQQQQQQPAAASCAGLATALRISQRLSHCLATVATSFPRLPRSASLHVLARFDGPGGAEGTRAALHAAPRFSLESATRRRRLQRVDIEITGGDDRPAARASEATEQGAACRWFAAASSVPGMRGSGPFVT